MDDKNLISKREVLEKYGISYGALYRWKRLGLIPEEWFIKKSAVTGQETFFQRDMITQRVEMILERKEKMSLEEIAQEIAGQQQEKRSQRKLTVTDRFTQKEYLLEELQSVVLTDGEKKISLLEYLRDITL